MAFSKAVTLSPVRCITLGAAIVAALLVSNAGLTQNTMFLRNSPIAHLNEVDRQILRNTIEEALEAPDGTIMEWSNPDTGSTGRVKVLDTHEDQGLVCRSLRARSEAHGRRADGIYRLCRDDTGKWRFASTERTPTPTEPEPQEEQVE